MFATDNQLPNYGAAGPSMFDTLSPRRPGPGAAALESAAAAAGQTQDVTLREVVVRTYDLGDEDQCGQYTHDLEALMLGVTLRTHVILAKEPLRFVEAGTPRYIAHLQWAEFELTETPITTRPVGKAYTATDEETTDGKQQ